MKRIYLIRHGDAYDADFMEKPVSPLNESGLKHAYAISERFKNEKVDQIFCSTMQRAVDTCAHFSKLHQNVTPIYKENLKEVADTKFMSEGEKYAFIKENFEALRQEVFEAFNELIEESLGENIFVFTHGHFIMFTVINMLKGDVDGFFRLCIDFTSVTIITVDDMGRLSLSLFNDCSHTKGLPYGCSWCS